MTQPPSEPCPRCKQPIEGSMAVHYAEVHGEYIPLYLERQGQPQRNPLRAALERFGRERRGQSQPILKTQHNGSTWMAVARALWERGQPQPRAEYLEPIQPHAFVASMVGPDCRVCVAPASNAIHVGEPISRSVQRRLGQPQQEPAVQLDHCARCGHYKLRHYNGAEDTHGWYMQCREPGCKCEAYQEPAQERQAGGHHHVHEQGIRSATVAKCLHCEGIFSYSWWDGYERGVADAAAKP